MQESHHKNPSSLINNVYVQKTPERDPRNISSTFLSPPCVNNHIKIIYTPSEKSSNKMKELDQE